jgi:3-oxoacyl-[acyl-carrier-protein] synthase-3
MASILSFGRYLPHRVLDNAALARRLNCDAAWIVEMSGIEERRIADPSETVADLAARAARDCLENAVVEAAEIGLVILSSGTAERRFPGPAAELAEKLGLAGVPAIDLPVASAGSLFGMALAAQLASAYGTVLVAAAEKMAEPALAEPLDRNVAILFGDGAGACLVSADSGFAEIVDFALATDGDFAETLRLDFDAPLHMDGRSIILQASRKLPRIISEVLERNHLKADAIGTYLMHQANLNLITRVAQSLGVPDARFFRNIARFGNTSSASLLIAATEWWHSAEKPLREPIVLAVFGAGLNWGAMLCR